ncbi:MAG TPA: restriction endonuclease subunit S [Candidatus Binatia bacterium]|nr:restriction endonuclease subunit S [Candidatus Binatia bacterium]
MAGEWHQTTLGSITAKGYGLVDGPFGSNLPASCYTEHGVPVIRGSNLTLGTSRFRTHEFVFVSRDTAQRLERSLCRPFDIVFTKKGTLGQTGLVPDGGPYELYLLSSNQMKLTVDRRLADPLFVYYFVSSPESTRKIIQDSEATGVPKTNVTYLRDFPITLPPLLEQRAIAHILGTLDDKIELNRRMNETLEQMARALFKSWFVDFNPVRVKAEGRDPGLPGPLDDLFPARFEDSELGKIPAGWRVSSLGTLFPDDTECVLTGPFGSNLHAHDYREEGVPLILVKHVVDGHILEDDLPLVGAHKLGDMERYRLVVGDIVFTRVGAVGRSAYVHPRYSGWLISGQMLRVRVPDWTALHPRYLAQVFLEKSFTDMVEGYALGTNTRLRLQMMLRTR